MKNKKPEITKSVGGCCICGDPTEIDITKSLSDPIFCDKCKSIYQSSAEEISNLYINGDELDKEGPEPIGIMNYLMPKEEDSNDWNDPPLKNCPFCGSNEVKLEYQGDGKEGFECPNKDCSAVVSFPLIASEDEEENCKRYNNRAKITEKEKAELTRMVAKVTNKMPSSETELVLSYNNLIVFIDQLLGK